MSSTQSDPTGSEGEIDAAYNHRFHLVRTCSLCRTVPKTFLEPICDDCLLLELGLAPGIGAPSSRDDGEHDENNLNGAEWLLESRVEITVEPPAENDDVFSVHSKRRALCSSSEEENADETPKRGRGRRRAMDLPRESLDIDEGSPLKRRSRPLSLKQAGQHLRRARKQHDLGSSSSAHPDLPKSPSTRATSWIEHLKSDLERRVRKKRPDARQKTQRTRQADSSNDASSSATEDDRILSLPSVPATASSAFSTISGNFEEFVILPLDQLISSSEFESSDLFVSTTHLSENKVDNLHSDPSESARPSTSSTRSAKSFHTATSTVSPSSSPLVGRIAGVGGGAGDVGISMHPLSCPILTSTCAVKDGVECVKVGEGHDRDKECSSEIQEMEQESG